MKTLDKMYRIEANPDTVWQALTDPVLIEGWGAGPAIMNSLVGTKFSLWGGEIWGTNTEVVQGRKLVQEWYDADMSQPTNLTLTLESDGQGTNILLHQTGIPEDRTEAIEDGWEMYYMGPLKEYIENREILTD